MSSPKPILYQFALSHYCEKARWALDYKGIDYQIVNFVPGPHLFQTRRIAPQTSLPILVENGNVIQDSTEILHYLDQKYPEKSLTPLREDLKKEAIELEEYFDEEVGVHLRRFFYFYALEDRRLATSLLLQKAPAYGPPLYFFLFPFVKRAMKKAMKIFPEPSKKSEKRLGEALEFLSKKVQKDRFLVGGQFSRADLTAASLLAPLCTPPEHDFEWPPLENMPQVLSNFRQAHEKTPAFQWVLKIYQEYRQ